MKIIKKENIYIVIPAYNEGPKIGEVILNLKNYGYNIVAVDDGSKDNTFDIIRNHTNHAIRHPFNMGQGAAIQTGLDYANLLGADIAITFDADGQHQAEDIQKLIQPILNEGVDAVFGSRFLGKTINMPKIRGKFIKLATVFFGMVSGIKLSDANCGIRAFNRKSIQQIKITQNRMAHTLDIIEQVSINKLSYCEVPVTIEYSEYSLKKGQSLGGSLKIFIDWIMRL